MAEFCVTYTTNNSGGVYPLTTGNWAALQLSGWSVEWTRQARPVANGATMTIKAEAMSDALERAVEAFESATGQRAREQGCPCCGPPHYFSVETGSSEDGTWDFEDY